jgi:hypothetical protein
MNQIQKFKRKFAMDAMIKGICLVRFKNPDPSQKDCIRTCLKAGAALLSDAAICIIAYRRNLRVPGCHGIRNY